MFDRDPKQMKWLESLPASQEAKELLAKVKVSSMLGIPDLISLLQWAVEDAADQYDLDATSAQGVVDDLIYMCAMKKPKAAVILLLNLDNPKEELPPEILKESEEELAIGMLELANMAHQLAGIY